MDDSQSIEKAKLLLLSGQEKLICDNLAEAEVKAGGQVTININRSGSTTESLDVLLTPVDIIGSTEIWQDLLQALPNLTHSPNLMIFPSGGPNTLVFEPWVKQAMAAVPEVKTQFISYAGAEMNSCHHPSALGHSQMYAIAQPILAAALGW